MIEPLVVEFAVAVPAAHAFDMWATRTGNAWAAIGLLFVEACRDPEDL